MIGKAQEATCTSHQDQKFQHLHKIAVGKKKSLLKRKKFPATVVFSFLHSPCFPSPSYSSSPFSLCNTLAYTFLPRLCIPPPFFLHPSISPSPLMSPSALPLFLHATPFWERTGPGLGCQPANKKWMNPAAVLLRQVGRKTGELSGRRRGRCEIC